MGAPLGLDLGALRSSLELFLGHAFADGHGLIAVAGHGLLLVEQVEQLDLVAKDIPQGAGELQHLGHGRVAKALAKQAQGVADLGVIVAVAQAHAESPDEAGEALALGLQGEQQVTHLDDGVAGLARGLERGAAEGREGAGAQAVEQVLPRQGPLAVLKCVGRQVLELVAKGPLFGPQAALELLVGDQVEQPHELLVLGLLPGLQAELIGVVDVVA